MPYTHVAYSDEAYTNNNFRSIAVISFKREDEEHICKRFPSSKDEMKWAKLRTRNTKEIAEKALTNFIDLACEKKIRADILIWSLNDSRRYKVKRYDDIKDLKIMYHQIFKNIMNIRYTTGLKWGLFPDENSAIDWNEQKKILGYVGDSPPKQKTLTRFDISGINYSDNKPINFNDIFSYYVHCIEPKVSHECVFIQLADLFAGLGAFSYLEHKHYKDWEKESSGQPLLFQLDEVEKLTNSRKWRFNLLSKFIEVSRNHNLGIAFDSSKGLETKNPKNPINFWFYKPKGPHDKAPVRKK